MIYIRVRISKTVWKADSMNIEEQKWAAVLIGIESKQLLLFTFALQNTALQWQNTTSA